MLTDLCSRQLRVPAPGHSHSTPIVSRTLCGPFRPNQMPTNDLPNQAASLTPLFNPRIARNELCTFCMERWEDDDLLFRHEACGNSFHHSCLSTWLSSNDRCPFCRGSCRKDAEHPGDTLEHRWQRHYRKWNESRDKHVGPDDFLSVPGHREHERFNLDISKALAFKKCSEAANDLRFEQGLRGARDKAVQHHTALAREEDLEFNILEETRSSGVPGFDFGAEMKQVHIDYRQSFNQMTWDSQKEEDILWHQYQAEKNLIKYKFELKYTQALGRLHHEEKMWPWADDWPEAPPTMP